MDKQDVANTSAWSDFKIKIRFYADKWRARWPRIKAHIIGAANVCNIVASFGVIFAVIFFILGQRDRETQEEASAWAALANPRAGISVARQIEYLSKDGWSRSKSTFDNINLVPSGSNVGVSLDGLTLQNSSMENIKLDGASLHTVNISDTTMNMASLSRSKFQDSAITSVMMLKADMRQSRFINSTFQGLFTGGDASKSVFDTTNMQIGLRRTLYFNTETREWDDLFNFNMQESFFQDSHIELPVDEPFSACGTIEMERVEFFYSSISSERETEVVNDLCMLKMNKSWIVGSTISGATAIECSGCTIAYSSVQIEEGIIIKHEPPSNGSIPLTFNGANLDKATIYRTTLSGSATGVSFENSKFLKVDASQFSFHNSNLSGAEFDNYAPDLESDSDRPDDFLMIYWYGHGRVGRTPRGIDADEFAMQLTEQETAEDIRKRYPPDGFKQAWAWRDRAPKGIPDGIAGPILCDPALRGSDEGVFGNIQHIPEECKPSGWIDVSTGRVVRIAP